MSATTTDPSVAYGQRLAKPWLVQVVARDLPEGGGLTPSGLFVQHAEGMPAIFGRIVAVGREAQSEGYAVGDQVVFSRYAGEVTDAHPDGLTFWDFHFDDVLARIDVAQITPITFVPEAAP